MKIRLPIPETSTSAWLHGNGLKRFIECVQRMAKAINDLIDKTDNQDSDIESLDNDVSRLMTAVPILSANVNNSVALKGGDDLNNLDPTGSYTATAPVNGQIANSPNTSTNVVSRIYAIKVSAKRGVQIYSGVASNSGSILLYIRNYVIGDESTTYREWYSINTTTTVSP